MCRVSVSVYYFKRFIIGESHLCKEKSYHHLNNNNNNNNHANCVIEEEDDEEEEEKREIVPKNTLE